MKRSTNPRKFLTEDESRQVTDTIGAAEAGTSAEIKLIIVRHCWGDLRDKAAALFARHGLGRTAERNCVLILLVLTNREFVIYGDRGIHEKVGEDFWVDVRNAMLPGFEEDRFAAGLSAGIDKVREKLTLHFPRREGDVNEIPDDIAYED